MLKEIAARVLLTVLPKNLYLRLRTRVLGRDASRVRDVETGICDRRSAFLDLLLTTLPDGVVPFVGGSDREQRVRLNLDMAGTDAFLAWLGALPGGWADNMTFRTPQGAYASVANLCAGYDRDVKGWIDIHLTEDRASSGAYDVAYVSVVEIVFWDQDQPSYKGNPPFRPARSNALLNPVRPDAFAKLTAPGAKGGLRQLNDIAPGRDIYTRDFPIDVVYTWVDDKDPVWQDAKEQAATGGQGPKRKGSRAALNERFFNRNELLYSLRSLELYAPFVRHVYLVTAGQRPDWLVADHPRLTVVDHSEIFSDPDVLPVFNSSAIETQLHHVPGLSEHFLYMNDDFFFGQICEGGDFFHSNGIARIALSDSRISTFDIDNASEEYIIADKNALDLFAQSDAIQAAPLMIHSPYPARVSLLNDMEAAYPQAFADCARQKFRSTKDIRPIAFMFPHMAYHRNLAVPATVTNRYLALWKPAIKAQLNGVLHGRRYKTFCINDVGLKPEREAVVNAAVGQFLQDYFPRKSSFEK